MNICIAICDDERQQTAYLQMLAEKWAGANNIKINVALFESAEAFKREWSRNKIFDLLLLDIQMDGQNGVELAKDLRGAGEDLAIIFITALVDFISEGYEVSALHYLLKPVNENKLYETLDKAYRKITQSSPCLIINAGNKDHKIRFDDIVYIEAFKHYVNIVTADKKEYETRRSISHIENELDNRFFRCQRSFIVMVKHIRHISKTEVTMDNGKIISLSRTIYKDLYKAFIRYFKGKEEFFSGGGEG